MNSDEKNQNSNEIERSYIAMMCDPIRRILTILRDFFCNTPSDTTDGRVTRTFRYWRNQLRNVFGGRRRRNSTGQRHYRVNSYPRLSLPPFDLKHEYDMNSEKRGIAVIFNHENFDYHTFQTKRTGTNFDLEKLVQTFSQLGFDIRDFTDLKKDDIVKHLKKVSSMNHKNYDCLLVVVLTHGEIGRIFSRDEGYAIDILTHFFTDKNCPSLRGKPKLFFIQSCRGEMRDSGYSVDATTNYHLRRQDMGNYEEVDVTTFERIFPEQTEMAHNPPNHPDFLIVRSTMVNYVSYRNTTRGSWFIQDLCEVLDKYAYDADILTLLTYVNNLVSMRESHPQKEKQIICISSMLTKLLIFKPKK